MIKVYAALMVFVCLLGQTAAAQEPKIDRTVILDISIIEITAARAEDIEAMTRDKQRLNSLIAEGKARHVASLQMRSRSNESATAQMGQRVPIQTATLPALNRSRSDSQDQNVAAAGVPQISYENIGLVVAATPRIVSSDQVEVRLKIEQTGIERSTGALTPTFIHRNLQDNSRVRAGETSLLFGVVQNQAVWLGAPPASAQSTDKTSGSFAVLLTARIVD
jgi:hypothetical protein